MTTKFSMTTASVTDLVNTLGIQRSTAKTINSTTRTSLDELITVKDMPKEMIKKNWIPRYRLSIARAKVMICLNPKVNPHFHQLMTIHT